MTQLNQTTLYTYQSKNTTLAEAVANCSDDLEGAVALLYCPRECRLATFKAGSLHDVHDREIPLNYGNFGIFEARIFNSACELRWLNHQGGEGKAVLISETPKTPSNFSKNKVITCESIEQQYLLWGKKADNQPQQDHWQRLAEARIGKLDIPFNSPLTNEQKVYLITHEYIAEWLDESELDTYGNVAVVEERLVKLEAR
jgi:CRISPR-associated protein (TIGR03984 family)